MPHDLEYTVKGALMMCDKGAVPAPFSPTSNPNVHISGALVSNEMDVAPMVNIPVFGVCAARGGQPCTPVPTKWMDTYAVRVHGGRTLLYKSYLPCRSGGKIEFLTSGQVPLPPGKMEEIVAEHSAPEEPEDEGWGWWDTAELIPFVGNVIGMVREARKGNWGMVALNAAFLVVDIVTAGAGSAITAPLKGGIKAGVKTMAKTAAKTAAKATTKAGAKQLAKAGARAVAGAVRKQVDEIAEAGGKMLTYACFPAGTLVAGEDGPLAIENVRNGMLVWSQDSETGEIALKRAKDRSSRTIATTTIVRLADESIETTAEHPFYTKAGWKMAADLQANDELRTREGHWHTVLEVTFCYEEKTVYNFEVEDFHTYFVGKWEWLVHNASSCKGLKGLGKKAGKTSDDIAGAGKKGKGRNQADRKKCTKEGHPVDVATGKLYTEHVDFTLPGPLPLIWERVWYSTSDHKRPIGHGWHHAYDLNLARQRDGNLRLRLSDGRDLMLPMLHVGQRHFNPQEKLTLHHQGTRYMLVDEAYREYYFNAESVNTKTGAPLLKIARNGAEITFSYNDKTQYLERIKDSGGRLLTVDTDKAGRILAIHAPHPGGERARIDDRGRVEKLEGRFPLVRYQYQNGNLAVATDPLDYTHNYEYKGHLLTKETNRNGLNFYFEWDGRGTGAKCIQTWGDGGIHDVVLTYDDKNKITKARRSTGAIFEYHYNDQGLVTKKIDSLGAVSEKVYDEHQRVLREVDELGRITTFKYDESSNLINIGYPDGTSVEMSYEGHLLVEAEDQNGGRYRWDYNEQNQLTERITPAGETTLYDYEGPALTSITDALTNRSELFYDDSGNLIALVGADKSKTTWTYDSLGRSLVTKGSKGTVESRNYNLRGDLLKSKEADGNVKRYEYDGEQNPTKIKDKLREVSMEYGGMSLLKARVENGTRVEFVYDSEESLVGIVNEHGYAYRFGRDLNGKVISESGFDGLTKKYLRDPAGQVATIVRPANKRTEYTYDAAGRPTKIKYWDRQEEFYAYRADGALMRAENTRQSAVRDGARAGAKVSWERDAVGRAISETRDGHRIDSEYNALGGRTKLTSSLGADVKIRRNRFGEVINVNQIGTAGNWMADIERDALGLEIDRSLPGGVRSEWKRDKLGRPLQQITTVGGDHRASRSYEWGMDDRLKALTISGRGRFEFEHDAVGNLAAATYPGGRRDLRMPDAVGNLFRSSDRSDREYGPSGQLRRSGTTTYEYDGDGNLVTKQDAVTGEAWHYAWNSAGMLQTVYRPDGKEVHFTYDALGRRLTKRFGADQTNWLWDGDVPLHEWKERLPERFDVTTGNLVVDLDAAVSSLVDEVNQDLTTWLFEPDGFAPMAKLSKREQLSILTDHLGTPTQAYDSAGDQRFRLELDIYGEVLSGERTEEIPFRYPGQYHDLETRLYYNRFRYYDAQEGVYLSQDPIGLAGGLGLYSYAKEPNILSDVFGLSATWFRALSKVDMTSMSKGGDIISKNPLANQSVVNHINFGSQSWYGDQYVSVTKNRAIAEDWARKSGTNVIELDIKNLDNDFIDLSTPEGRHQHIMSDKGAKYRDRKKASRFAEMMEEGLIKDSINKSAITNNYTPPCDGK